MSWIEQYIIGKLIAHNSVRIKDLKPDGIESNLLSHYLKRLIIDGYVIKVGRGIYTLTSKGEKLGGTYSTVTGKQSETLKSCIVLYSKNSEGKYLLLKWKRQPYIQKVSLINDRIKFGDTINEAMNRALDEKLGGVRPTKYRTSGFIRIMHDDYLVSHMQVVVYEVDNANLRLPFTSKNGTVFWDEITSPETMSGLANLVQYIEKNEHFDVILNY